MLSFISYIRFVNISYNNHSNMMKMDVKKYLDFRLLGLIGSILMIISIFLPWMTGLTLFETYILTTMIQVEDAFLYLFPLISGSICLLGAILLIYDKDFRINSVIINFIGLSFLLLFLSDFLPAEINYLSTIGIGFYLCVTGFLLIILDIINILLINDDKQEKKINKEGN